MPHDSTPDHALDRVTPPAFKLQHRLQVLMEDADVTAADMATALGVHKNTVYNYLSGSRKPSLSAVKVWALRCGKPALWTWIQTGIVPEDDGGGTTTTW